MKAERVIFLFGHTLWFRQPDGWRVTEGGARVDLGSTQFEELRQVGSGPCVLIFEVDGLLHTRVAGQFENREEFRESLRNRQRFSALGRDDLAWGVDHDRRSGKLMECTLHAECVPFLQGFSDSLNEAGLEARGGWSLWSLVCGPSDVRDGAVIAVITRNFVAVACAENSSAGPFFKTWFGERTEATERSIAAVVQELQQGREDELIPKKELRVYTEPFPADSLSLVSVLLSNPGASSQGFDGLFNHERLQRLRPVADLLRSFPRIVHLDKPILRAAIAMGLLFTAITAVAVAQERQSSQALAVEKATKEEKVYELSHRAENHRMMELFATSAGDHPLALVPMFRRLGPALPLSVRLTSLWMDSSGRFEAKGEAGAPILNLPELRAAFEAAGWTCSKMELTTDRRAWFAAGEAKEPSHGS